MLSKNGLPFICLRCFVKVPREALRIVEAIESESLWSVSRFHHLLALLPQESDLTASGLNSLSLSLLICGVWMVSIKSAIQIIVDAL